MRFFRKNGRIIPVRDKNDGPVNTQKVGVRGAVLGALYHTHQGEAAHRLESMAKNSRNIHTFKKSLKAGDILVMGSTPKNSGGHELGDILHGVPGKIKNPILKVAKKIGIKKDTVLLSNSTLLTGVGAGEKYHAGVYLGKGKVAHMTGDVGATIDHIGSLAEKQNVTALRFSNAGQRETAAAVNFAKKAVNSKAQYSNVTGLKNAFSNLVFPLSKKVSKDCSSMVCHTLPIRAYGKRAFTLGEDTFAGDFSKVPGITAVARRDLVKSTSLRAKAFIGNAAKGLKWGAAAALVGAAINYQVRKARRDKSKA